MHDGMVRWVMRSLHNERPDYDADPTCKLLTIELHYGGVLIGTATGTESSPDFEVSIFQLRFQRTTVKVPSSSFPSSISIIENLKLGQRCFILNLHLTKFLPHAGMVRWVMRPLHYEQLDYDADLTCKLFTIELHNGGVLIDPKCKLFTIELHYGGVLIGMVRWVMSPLDYEQPDYDAEPTCKLFTIELHYGGVLIGNTYRYGWVMRPLHYERPDYDADPTCKLFTIELHYGGVLIGMVRWVMRPLHYERPDYDAGVYGGIFEYLWMVPGEDIHVGLKPLHCDANVRSLTKGVATLKTICVADTQHMERNNIKPLVPAHLWTWMLDKQKGMINVLERRFPFVEHRYCVRHMWHNMAIKFKRSIALKNMMWDASRATYLQAYQEAMDSLHRRDVKCRMMKRLHKQRVRLARLPHDVICLIPARKLKVNKGKLAFWYPMYNGEGEFEVHGERTFFVKLHQFECACGSWKIYGIPSEQAIACINYNGEKLVDFVHDAFLVGTYNQSYSVAIRPLNDS
ncbi:hypothetical protein LINPERHAP2_LOCUS35648 [Linum perenne]